MTTKNFIRVDSAAKLAEHVRRMMQEGKPISIDTETGYDGPDRSGIALLHFHPDWKLVSIQFTNSTDWAVFVPIGFDDGNNIETVAAARLMWRMVNTGLCVAHNHSFELQALGRWFRDVLWDDPKLGAEVRAAYGFYPIFSDTMIEAFMMARYQRVGLKELTHNVLHQPQAEITSLFPELVRKKKTRFMRFNSLEQTPEVISYACEDVIFALYLHELHYPQIKDNFMFKVEIQLTPVLCEMEYEALELDWNLYERKEQAVTIFRERFNEEIQQSLSERLGETQAVNFNSPPQVRKLLYTDLGYTTKIKTDTGEDSTSEEAVRALAKKDADVKKILEWREITALLTRYLTKYLQELRYATDGRAHPNHKQVGAGTGRLSVDGVSYQQWPKPYHYELKDGTSLDLNYRDFLISPKGFRIIGYDFSQVELRILAGMAGETELLKAFADGTDVHRATAALMMGKPLAEVTKADRAKGKTLNFAVVYGSGPENIGDMLGISKEEAQALLDQYFAAFSKLKGWMDQKILEGRQQGFVETLFGRRFKIWEYVDGRKFMMSKGDRMCVNAPVQGGAADYMKIGMVRAQAAIKKAGLQDKIRMVMTIHDALEFYVHESVSTQEVIDLIQPAISFPLKGMPEILAEWHEGYKWGSVAEILLDENKKITGYEMTVEPPVGDALHWEDKELAAVLEPYQAWADAFYADKDITGEAAPSKPPVPKIEVPPKNDDSTYLKMLEDQGEDINAVPEWAATPMYRAELPRDEILVTLDDMPEEEQFDRLMTFLAENTGSQTTLKLITPEGEITLPNKFSLSAKDAETISSLLGGARVRRDSEIELSL